MCWRCECQHPPADTRRCTGFVHILRCSHAVQSHSPACTIACRNPNFGAKRYPPDGCSTCNTYQAEIQLAQGLDEINGLWEQWAELRRLYYFEPGMIAKLEELEDAILEKEGTLKSQVGPTVWHRYITLGQAAFVEQVAERLSLEDPYDWTNSGPAPSNLEPLVVTSPSGLVNDLGDFLDNLAMGMEDVDEDEEEDDDEDDDEEHDGHDDDILPSDANPETIALFLSNYLRQL